MLWYLEDTAPVSEEAAALADEYWQFWFCKKLKYAYTAAKSARVPAVQRANRPTSYRPNSSRMRQSMGKAAGMCSLWLEHSIRAMKSQNQKTVDYRTIGSYNAGMYFLGMSA